MFLADLFHVTLSYFDDLINKSIKKYILLWAPLHFYELIWFLLLQFSPGFGFDLLDSLGLHPNGIAATYLKLSGNLSYNKDENVHRFEPRGRKENEREVRSPDKATD